MVACGRRHGVHDRLQALHIVQYFLSVPRLLNANTKLVDYAACGAELSVFAAVGALTGRWPLPFLSGDDRSVL